MDVKRSWVLLVSSSLAAAVVGTTLIAQEAEAPKSRPAPLIYIPKTQLNLSRRKITRPAQKSRAEWEMAKKGIIESPERRAKEGSSDVSYQRPAEQYAAHEAAAHQSFAVVPKPTPSDGSSNQNGTVALARASAPRAPFVADRGPLRPATAIGRPTTPTQPSMAFPTSSIAKDSKHSGGATTLPGSNVEVVAPPVPAVPPAEAPNSIKNEALDGAKPIAQAVKKSTASEQANEAPKTIRVTHTITASPQPTPAKETAVLPTANTPRPLTVASVADSKPARPAEPIVQVDFTPTRQVVAHANQVETMVGTISELALVSFPDEEGSKTPSVQLAIPELPAITPPSIPNLNPASNVPAGVLPQVTMPHFAPHTPARPVELPAIIRPASIPSPTEPAVLPLPVIQQSANSNVQPTDVLLAELEREVAEMQSARNSLRNTVESTDMHAREIAARTNVAQAAQLQTLVTQVITKVRAEQIDGRTATTDPKQRTKVVSADELPADFITIGSRLYAKGMFEDAEVAFRTALDQAADSHDRTFASYLLATALRRQSELTEAARYYRDVAAQSEEAELRDLARWQLKNLAAKRTK